MAVYVDDFYKTGAKIGRMKMSHMIADTKQELIEMAEKIGVNKKWIQHEGTHKEHFDICLEKRALAIKLGANSITYRQLGTMCLNRKTKTNNL